jgi:RNA polymerase sigma-70 factor, ECF subfamily
MGVDASDGEVYRKYSDDLVRFATGLVGPSNAADVVAEAVLRCMSSSKWSTVERKKPYLYRSVFNEAKRFHRSTFRRTSREMQSARPEAFDPPEPRPEILAALGELSIQQRAVIFLTYWEDLSPSGVAGVLRIGEGSVKRHLARGRRRLKEVLDAIE